MGLKKNFTLLLIFLTFIFGFLGVVSAATGITVTYPNGGEYVKDGVIITWSVTGSQTTDRFDVRYSPNNGVSWTTIVETLFYTTRSHEWDTSSAADGSNYLIQVVESGSSPGAPDDVSNSVFTVDNTNPTSSAGPLSPYQNTATFNVPFSVTDANPDSVELWYRKDSGAWTSYGTFTSSPISFTGSGDGDYDFYTIATDKAGNTESAPGSADDSTTVDTVKPTTTDDYTLTGWQSSDKTIILTPADSTPSSGIEWTKYCIDATNSCDPASGTPYTASVIISTEGTNYFRYASKDNAGNVQNTVSKTVMIDKSAPTAGVSGAPSGFIVGGSVDASSTCSDLTSGCLESKVYVSSTSVDCSTIPYTNYFSSPQPVTGHQWVCAATKDVAGNTGFSSPVEFTIFSTIQSAIDAASPGATINVAAGTYAESILIDKTLILTGDSKPVITGDALHNYIVKVTVNDVVFDNFEVNGGGSRTGDNTFDYGIWAIGTDNLEIKNSVIKNIWKVSSNGIEIDDSTNSDVHDNLISSFHKRGIRYIHSSGTFHNNEVFGESVNGVDRVQNLVNLWTGSNVTIYNNNLHNALTLVGSTPLWDSPAIFVSSYYAGYPDSGSSYADIHDNEIYNGDTGVVVGSYYSTTDSSSATITNNNFHDLHWGINFEKSTASSIIHYNKFANVDKAVSADDGSGGPTPQPIINAERNWWGTAGESTIQGLVYGNVDYTPFAEDNTLTRFYAPVLGAVGDQSVDEGSPLTIILSATDADAVDTLAYSNNVEFGSLVDNTFTWTPTGANQGAHTITFTVSDGDLTNSETITITVNNVAPIVNAGTDQTVNEGILVSFSATATDAGNDVLTYSWNFGDSNTTGTGQSTTHIYADNGVYTVTLSVDDGTTTATDTLTVTVNNVAPVITSINANPLGTTVGSNIAFSATAIDVSDVLTYSWNFGDTQTSTLQNPIHAYSSKGTYTVTLTVTDGDGGSDTETLTVPINDLIWNLLSEWNLVSAPKTTAQNMAGLGNRFGYDNGWITNPTAIEAGMGYWIASSDNLGLDYVSDCTFPQCLPSGKINIDALNNGWNLIGLTTTEDTEVQDSFGSMIYDDTHLPVYYVVSYDGDDFELMEAWNAMYSGEGYWAYVVK